MFYVYAKPEGLSAEELETAPFQKIPEEFAEWADAARRAQTIDEKRIPFIVQNIQQVSIYQHPWIRRT